MAYNLEKRKLRKTFLLISCLYILLQLSACSAKAPLPGLPASQLDVEVQNASKVLINPELEQESQALHSFLVGQLALKDQDMDLATSELAKASSLVKEPVPLLHEYLAKLYVKGGDLEEALEQSKKALEAEPDNKSNLLLQAGILEALNRDMEAEPIYLQVIAKHPQLVDAYVLLSSLYVKQSKFDTAEQLLASLVKLAPEEALAYYYLGRVQEQHEKLEAARDSYSKALELEGRDGQMRIDYMRVLAKLKDFDRLKVYCTRILDRDPNDVTARKVLGQILLGESRYEDALQHLKVLESAEHDVIATRLQIAAIEAHRRNYDEAARELNLILAQQPEHDEARYQLASVLASTGETKEAVAELLKIKPGQELFVKSRTFAAVLLRQRKELEDAEKAIREALEEQSDKQALSYLILILRDAKKYEEAKILVEEVLKDDPDNERLLFNYGLLLNEMGQHKESEKQMRKVVGLNPENSDALNFLAYALAERGEKLEEALRLISQALNLKGNDGYYLDTQGWIYFKLGRFQEAEETLARAVNLLNDDYEILEHYGDALAKTGKADKAILVYKTALERLQDAVSTGEAEEGDDYEGRLQRLRFKVERLENPNTK